MKNSSLFASTMMLAAVAIISGCTMDTIEESFSPNDAEVSLTVVIDEVQTRTTLSDEGTTVSAAWEVGDELTFYNVTLGVEASETFKVTSVSDGKATVEGKLECSDGDVIALAYPAVEMENGNFLIDISSQTGALDGELVDYVYGNGTVSTSGGVGTLSVSSLSHPLAINRFAIEKSGSAIAATNLFVSGVSTTATLSASDGSLVTTNSGSGIIVTPSSASSSVYVAMMPFSDNKDAITFVATDGSAQYAAQKTPASMSAGKFYTATLSMASSTAPYIFECASLSNGVNVIYSGNSANVIVGTDVADLLTITASGTADVSIVQSADVSNEITYTLSGSSDDGSFYMDGELKATVVLSDLTLTSTSTAPVNIDNGKRINIQLVGTSTLKDSEDSDGKAALMVNGHSEFTGDGTLNLYGYAKHAYWADEYVQLKKSMTGTINILYAKKDGLNVNQHFEMNGGNFNVSGTLDDGIQVSVEDDEDDEAETGYVNIAGGKLTITTTAAANKALKAVGDITINDDKSTPTVSITNSGTGEWDDDDAEVKGAACMASDGNITIDAGNITLTATGNGGKGLKCDGVFTMNDGSLTVSTAGKLYVQTGASGTVYDGTYSGNIDNLDDAYKTSPKGIRVGVKADGTTSASGDLVINGGTLTVTCSGEQDGSEGIESKNTLTINGGTISVDTYDDCINSANDMKICGGTITAIASNNDGIDSNGDLYFNGGVTAAYGAASPENGVDAAEGYSIYFNGGTLLCVGGSAITPTSASTAAYVSTTGTVSANKTIALKSGSTTLCSWTVPATYTSSSSNGAGGPGGWNQGGGSSKFSIIITHADLVSGSSYTLTNGSSSSSVTAKTGSSSGGW